MSTETTGGVDIGQLYDDHVAAQYDADPFGLLTHSREAAAAQIGRHVDRAGEAPLIVDFALGTGESLLAIEPLFPRARFVGIDVSERMLQVARSKFDVRTVLDDARNACAHVEASSADLVLSHFLATYVDPPTLARNAATVLRTGGCFSFVNGTREGFRALQGLALRLIPEEKLRELAPSPDSPASLEAACTAAGFEICEAFSVSRPVSFATYEEFYDFGFRAGWFTHLLAGVDEGTLAKLGSLAGVFPLHDEFKAAVILARKL